MVEANIFYKVIYAEHPKDVNWLIKDMRHFRTDTLKYLMKTCRAIVHFYGLAPK